MMPALTPRVPFADLTRALLTSLGRGSPAARCRKLVDEVTKRQISPQALAGLFFSDRALYSQLALEPSKLPASMCYGIGIAFLESTNSKSEGKKWLAAAEQRDEQVSPARQRLLTILHSSNDEEGLLPLVENACKHGDHKSIEIICGVANATEAKVPRKKDTHFS